MKILIVCRNKNNKINPFITEQANALSANGITINYFLIGQKGIIGYLAGYINMIKTIKSEQYDFIHAHYGLSGLIAVLQRRVPVVITFHGSDVNKKGVRLLSIIAAHLSFHNIIVEKGFARKLKLRNGYSVIPCGIETSQFHIIYKEAARMRMRLPVDENIILFSSAFNNPVKNYNLAKAAVEKLRNAKLIELKNYSREEVNYLMNAADALLLTSFTEGSPQVVKEAMACNLPVVSTPVGDVRKLFLGTRGNYLVPYDADMIAHTLRQILQNKYRTTARKNVLELDNDKIAKRIISVYQTYFANGKKDLKEVLY